MTPAGRVAMFTTAYVSPTCLFVLKLLSLRDSNVHMSLNVRHS